MNDQLPAQLPLGAHGSGKLFWWPCWIRTGQSLRLHSPTAAGSSKRGKGKDGPNALFVWPQGEKHPVDQPIAEESRIDVGRHLDYMLPETFEITGWWANGDRLTAKCGCIAGVCRRRT